MRRASPFGQGLLSGVGHPVIGVDHFAFVVAVGITAALAGRLWALTLSFVAGSCGKAVRACPDTIRGSSIAETARAARSVQLLDAAARYSEHLPADPVRCRGAQEERGIGDVFRLT